MQCQDCQTNIPIEQGTAKNGDVINCPNCGAEYEIVSTDPLKAELIEEEK